MKRMHIHISVENLAANIEFYSALFGSKPSVIQSDYAKWMLDDPRVNFAISNRGARPGLDHLGIQAENNNELNELAARLETASLPARSEPGAQCCYAKGDKHWTVDPQGIAWESFHTLASIPTFGSEPVTERACCAPQPATIKFGRRA